METFSNQVETFVQCAIMYSMSQNKNTLNRLVQEVEKLDENVANLQIGENEHNKHEITDKELTFNDILTENIRVLENMKVDQETRKTIEKCIKKLQNINKMIVI
jgi:uncharacterized protein YktB (UPF0637 family)